jgi:hypothetical protein
VSQYRTRSIVETSDLPLAEFRRIALEAESAIGYGLFTVTWFDAAAMEVQRVYSTNPLAYPVGGRKAKRDTAWGRHVLIECRPLVCEGDAAIARMFDDHAAIRGLGLHASVNVPVLGENGCVGVLNFLMIGQSVSPRQLHAASEFAKRRSLIAALADPGPAHTAPASGHAPAPSATAGRLTKSMRLLPPDTENLL